MLRKKSKVSDAKRYLRARIAALEAAELATAAADAAGLTGKN
jgi:hypothetical protein